MFDQAQRGRNINHNKNASVIGSQFRAVPVSFSGWGEMNCPFLYSKSNVVQEGAWVPQNGFVVRRPPFLK